MKTVTVGNILGLVFVAYLCTTNERFLEIDRYWSHPNFRLLLGLTILVFNFYMLWISIVYVVQDMFFGWYRKRVTSAGRFACYFVVAFVPVVSINSAALELLLRQGGRSLYTVGYFKTGIFFFVVPLIGYIGMIYLRPGWSMYVRLFHRFAVYIVGVVRGLYVMASQARVIKIKVPSRMHVAEQKVLPAPQTRTLWAAQILAFRFTARATTAYLIDGSQLAVRFSSSELSHWAAAPWFVLIRDGFYLNMYYISHAADSIYHLVVEHTVEQTFLKKAGWKRADLIEFLTVSKRLRKNVAQHFEHRPDLDLNVWNDSFHY